MPTPAATALDNTDEHATTALYRAAIGQVNSAYYLPLFERFEAADRAGLRWNGAAALYTLNWLAFRQLWHAALLYAGVLVMLALGIFGIGRLLFQFSDTTQWALAGGLLLLSVLLPGLGGNALLHAATRKRMEAALNATHTVAEACTLLARKAPTRKGLIAQMVANVLCLGLLGYAWVQFEGWSPETMAVAVPDARNVAVGRTVDGSVQAPAPAPAASAPARSASAPQAAASAPLAAASAPQTVASAPQVVASAPASAASAPAASAAASAPAPAPAKVAPAAAAAAAAPAKATSAAPRAAAPAPKATPPVAAPRAAASAPRKIILLSKPIAVESASNREPAPASTSTPSASRAAPADAATAQAQRYVVLVGLFTLENNARNAYTQVMDAELPARTQSVRTAQGTRFRVTAGPFDTEAEADRAADRIRALGLAAQVAPQ